MSVYYGLTGGGVGRVIAGKAGIYDLDTDFLLGAGISTAYVVTTINESTIVVAKTGTYRVWLGGAGGGGANGLGGYGGIFYFDIDLVGGETVYAGVGAGGTGPSTSQGLYQNSASYACRGGNGGGASGYAWGGAGGGGSYLKLATPGSRANYNGYVGIAGGGGGGCTHSYTANYGGHGFGVGGTAWSTSYAETNSGTVGSIGTLGGRNGFSTDGFQGAQGYPQSSGSYGGSCNPNTYSGSPGVSGQLVGAQGSLSTTGYGGGGGGGGAGGGASGASGGASGLGNPGGYLSTSTTLGSYTTVINAMGGGGGGSHGNNCGGTAGGGGTLLFTAYTNSWGSTQGTQIPYWQNSIGSATLSQYTAWSNLSTYSTTYLGSNYTTGTLSNKCTRGGNNGTGSNGFVLIAPLNITPIVITTV